MRDRLVGYVSRALPVRYERAKSTPSARGVAAAGSEAPRAIYEAQLRKRATQLCVPASLTALILTVPLWISSGVTQDKILVVLLYVLGGLGLNTLFGYAGEFSFAPGVNIGIAAYATGILSADINLPLFASIVLSVLIAVMSSLLIHASGLRVRGWYFALTSFFAVIIFPDVVDLFPSVTGGDEGLSGIPPVRPFGTPGSAAIIYEVIAGCVVATVFTYYFMLRDGSKLRRALLSLHHSPRACVSVGVSPPRLKLLSYVLAGIPLGISGALLAHLQGSVSSNSFGLAFAIALFAGVILGGPGNFWGPLLGVVVVYIVSLWVGPFSSYNALILAVFILLVGLILPIGRNRPRIRLPRLRFLQRGAHATPGADICARPALYATTQFINDGEDRGSLSPSSAVAAAQSGPNKATLATRASIADNRDSVQVHGVQKAFGGVAVLNGVSLSIGSGELVGLLGPNGSGKTTLLNVLSGLVRADQGEVRLEERLIGDASPTAIAKLGVARTFQLPEIVGPLPAWENVVVGMAGLRMSRPSPRRKRGRWIPTEERHSAKRRQRATEICLEFGLEMREINTACEELSLGTRRIVEVARALAFGAKVVLLDEPAAGLNGDERDRLARSLRRFRDAKQCAMLVVEHNPEFVVDLSDRILLLDSGKVIEEWVVGSGAMPRQLQRFLDLEDVHGAPVSVLNETLDGL